jgi:hypothetical protein
MGSGETARTRKSRKEMIGYASNTGTIRNIDALREAGWRLLITPSKPKPPEGFRFGIDNGAWGAYASGTSFDERAFKRLTERYGSIADWVVIPDIVAGGEQSFDFSRSWMPYLKSLRMLLLPVQDGMNPQGVGPFLRDHCNVGLFLGGSTEWKLREMCVWGAVAHTFGRHYHIGRVNTRRRIRLAHEAGADSFDGTSATRFSCTLPLLEAARRQPKLITVRSVA